MMHEKAAYAFTAFNTMKTRLNEPGKIMWLALALLSAFFAALTSILAKVGIEGVDSNLGTAIRTLVVFIMACGMAFLTGARFAPESISGKSWLFLILSGMATGASWLCYFKALQLGTVSKVVSVDKMSILFAVALAAFFLHEPLGPKTVLASLLIAAGTLIMVL